MIIHPEIIVTPDLPTIRFKEPREQVDLDKELPRILHTQGWGCGTYFHVQFLNHEKTKLLASATFVVSEEVESIHTNLANEYQPVTRTVFTRKAEQIGDWWGHDIEGEKIDAAEDESPETKPAVDEAVVEGVIAWNPHRQIHELTVDGKVVYENKDRKKVERVAAGETADAA